MKYPNQYMLMFSLGPVQPFIEQARKTRDLWLGSYLLAKLMEAAMKDIDTLGGQFVFPTYQKVDDESANLPNKYIAIFSDATLAQQAAQQSKKQIEGRWKSIRDEVWNKIVQGYGDNETEDIWKQQSNPDICFEFQWVIVEGDPSHYKEWLMRTELALDARKRLRNFQQQEEPGEKSTISGERQALHRILEDRDSERRQVRSFWIALTTSVSNVKDGVKRPLSAKEISLDGSERLDAIDTIKRFASMSQFIPKSPFPSTSSIATASFVEGLLNIDQNKLQPWLDATKSLREIPIGATKAIPYLLAKAGRDNEILRRDGDCYFRETFISRRLEKDYGISNADEAARIAIVGRRGLEQLFEATDEKGMRRPTPYYAIIKMDGDRMGELLNTANNQDEHVEISQALSTFTRNDVSHILHDRYPARLVYAGGDDVLALAPLARNLPQESKDQTKMIKTVIELANHLQQQYRTRVSEGLHHEVTASISIAIAHHYAPLSFVLRTMRDGERRLAKERFGRNALVVTVIRRSGAQTQVGCRWEYKGLEKEAQPMALFSHFYELFAEDILSSKCVYILLEEAPFMVDLELAAQASEIRRVILRQLKTPDNKERLEEISKLASHLVNLASAMDIEHKFENKSVQLEEDKPHYGLVEVLGWLLLMVFLTRKEE